MTLAGFGGAGGGFAGTCPALLWIREQESQAENFLGTQGKLCYDQAMPKYFSYSDF